MKSPYTGLKPNRFWRTGVSEAHPLTVPDLYAKKFAIAASDKIATAGSCFAQHVANYLRTNGFSVIDFEPSPHFLSPETAKAFGYGIYSARYGNIYTVRQLLQLAQDADSGTVDPLNIWTKGDRFYDALRPNIEPDGFDSPEEATVLREQHLAKVKRLLRRMNVFIFTLGLTEAWVDKRTGRVFPTAPGTIAGDFDPDVYEFKNFTYDEIYEDFVEFRDLICARNRELKIILTVSPVPLTATATDNHVLVATTYSKSVLRAVAGSLADTYSNVDYFPSYEMIASPWSKGFFYESNMREVNSGGVAAVMRVFFDQHGAIETPAPGETLSEEARPEATSERRPRRSRERTPRAERPRPATEETAGERRGKRPNKRAPRAERQIAAAEGAQPEAASERRRRHKRVPRAERQMAAEGTQPEAASKRRQRRERAPRAERLIAADGTQPEAASERRRKRANERTPRAERQMAAAEGTDSAGERRRRRPEERVPDAQRQRHERPSRAEAKAARAEVKATRVKGKATQAKSKATKGKATKSKATRAKAKAEPTEAKADEVVCEDILLEAFNT